MLCYGEMDDNRILFDIVDLDYNELSTIDILHPVHVVICTSYYKPSTTNSTKRHFFACTVKNDWNSLQRYRRISTAV